MSGVNNVFCLIVYKKLTEGTGNRYKKTRAKKQEVLLAIMV